MGLIRWFIGYDSAEPVAWHVMAHSILRRSSVPVSIIPIALPSLPMYTRTRERQSTEFTFSRWLVPYLCDYSGWAVFSDSDMLLRADPAELWSLRDNSYSVQCVKHEYAPAPSTKFLDRAQVAYPRKCWSSLALMNCEALRDVTPEYVRTAPADDLRQMWFLDAAAIGALPREWNHLVGCQPENPDAKLVHWTLGTPCFYEYQDAEFADEWRAELAEVNRCDSV